MSHYLRTPSKDYVVKYLGIVEGNVGCLSRKMALPTIINERVQSVTKKGLK